MILPVPVPGLPARRPNEALRSIKDMFHDSYGREVNYIRLSVTDRCNLQCFYCRTDGCVKFIPHENVLSYEEMLRLVKAAEKMNVSKLRLTGGEPFVRKDFLAFLGMLK